STSAAAVLRDDTSSTPSSWSARASSGSPVLSYTDSSARCTLTAFSAIVPNLDLAARDAGDHIRIQTSFYLFDALVQAGFRVVVEHGYGFLSEDRPVVDLERRDVHGAAGDLHAERQRVSHRVPALERRQQRRVRVDDAPRIGVVNRLFKNRAEPGHRNQV